MIDQMYLNIAYYLLPYFCRGLLEKKRNLENHQLKRKIKKLIKIQSILKRHNKRMNSQIQQRIKSRILEQGLHQQVEQLCFDGIKIHSFSNDIVQEIFKCSNVLYITFNHCEITSLQNFPCIPSLLALQLVGNQIEGTDVIYLENCINLRHLALDDNSIKQIQDLLPLNRLDQIQHLQVRGNPVCLIENYRDKIFEIIPKLKIVDGHDVFGDQDIMYGTETESDGSQYNQSNGVGSDKEDQYQQQQNQNINGRKSRNT